MKTKQDVLLYAISVVETEDGKNYLKLCTFNAALDRSKFYFELETGRIAKAEIDTDNELDKQVYKKLVGKKGITLTEFLRKCISADEMIGY